jgi:hypothetical protein
MTNTTQINNLYGVSIGTSSTNPFVDIFESRDPTVNDVNYPIQKKWLNTTSGTFWELQNFVSSNGLVTANWIKIGSIGLTETLTGNSGGAVPATANNINVVGTGSITTVGTPPSSTMTIELTGLTDHAVLVGAGTPTITNVLPTTAGFVLTSNGASLDPSFQANPGVGAIIRVTNQVFTTTGTYTPTSGMSYCSIQCMGAGGAGGGAPATSSTQCASAGAGGAGEYAVGIFSAATIGASKPVTIGAGGLGVSDADGNTGGTTSVGTLITAFGGQGGGVGPAETTCGATDGGDGGTGGSGGDYRGPGAPGGLGISTLISPGFIAVGGIGGSTFLGSGGIPQVGAGLPGTGYGAGGGGSSNIPSTVSATAGGNGASGIVIITEYIS